MDFAYQVSAELYYDTTYAMEQASQDSWKTQYEFGNNGDGSIWYPGKPSVIGGTHDIPVESLRMKMLREGMQDYEYLAMLGKLGDAAFAQTELAKVVTNAGSFTSDPGVLEQARADMATQIEKDLAKTDAGAGGGSCDGGAPGDAGGSAGDGGGTHDGGGSHVEGGLDDGGGTPDAGTNPGGSKSGCGCEVGDAGSLAPMGVGIAGLAAAWARRKRRKRG